MLLAGALGLVLGSFYALCAARYGSGLSVVRPRSRCPRCQRQLAAWENIPLFSFALLRGRCRGCGGAISLLYPATELASCVAAAALAWRFGPGLAWLGLMGVAGLMLVMSGIDARLRLLPDVLNWPCAGLSLAVAVLGLGMDLWQALAGALFGAGMLWAVRLVFGLLRRREGLGLGDVKLMLSVGALCGVLRMGDVLLMASLSAIVWHLLASGGRGRIAFGPFLCLAALVAVLTGPRPFFSL